MATNSSVRYNPLVKQTLGKLYQNKDKRGDITFLVESEVIRAHRCVLAALSPTFKNQFYKELSKSNSNCMNVTDATASAFKEFLQFFYLERVTLTAENVRTVFELSKKSQVDEFANECVRYISQTVNMDNLCSTYNFAIVYDIKQLKELCEQKMSANTSTMFANKDFLECNHGVLINILKLNTFNCKETDVFHACIAWARAACKRNRKFGGNMAFLRAELDNAIYEIRFGCMKIEEFVTIHKAYEGFFTKDESIELMYMIGKLKEFKSKHFNQAERKNTNARTSFHPHLQVKSQFQPKVNKAHNGIRSNWQSHNSRHQERRHNTNDEYDRETNTSSYCGGWYDDPYD